MRSAKLIPTAAAIAALGAITLAVTGARRADTVEVVDFGKKITATQPAYDARLAAASDASVKEFIIPITHDTIEIAKGVKYEGWTFGGTVPGPTIRVREGDRVRVKVVNKSPMPHSIDFHSARIPANVAYRTFMPGDSISFEFVARDPGAYMVHCGTPPITMHIMQGMYFAIIVDPKDGWGTKADKEFVLERVQTWTIPAGGGAVFETVFEKGASEEGIYPFVTHSFADAEKGAVGLIQVGTPKQFATMSH